MASEQETAPSWPTTGQKTVFINHVDSFLTGYLAKFLSSCLAGITLLEQDLQEEFEEEIEKDSQPAAPISDQSYRIIGSLKDSQKSKPHFVQSIVQNRNALELFQTLSECDIIIYDIVSDSSQNAEAFQMATKFAENWLKMEKSTKKTFVIISSVLTWGSITSAEIDDISPVFSDEDFRRRRPHKHYRELYNTEKMLLQYGRTKKSLNAYIVAPGLIYGDKEDVFHYLFKAAWLNQKIMPLINDGDNFLPTIHIKDLARTLQNLIEKLPPKNKYILAVDQSQNTLKSITKSVNQAMGSGAIQSYKPEEAIQFEDLNTTFVDMLTLDLRLSASVFNEQLKFKWANSNGMVENMPQLIEEFKSERGLKPLKMVIIGPPGVGKTSIAKRLQDSLKLHLISIEDIKDKKLKTQGVGKMEEKKSATNDFNAEVDEDDQEEEVEEKEEYETFLDSVEEILLENEGKFDNNTLITCLKKVLLSKPFQNQGFIIDGYPTTAEQVTLLFGTLDEVKEARSADVEPANKLAAILPDLVIKLNADDEFLKQRIRDLPAYVVEGTDNEEKAFTARLEDYRKLNTVENSIEDFLDELEFNLSFYDVTKDLTGVNEDILSQIKFSIGGSRTYAALEAQQKAEIEQKEEEERLLADEESAKNEKKLQWSKKFAIVQKEEKELLETQSLPLRHYLFQQVMPTLLNGLTECCKIMPEDPLDYLADYLLKFNPVVD
ncbi:hypothetical protein HELRODRAFT_83308 [Helobdella robusta]|uniref:ATPase AAA-type core domain-containing protein n=1 Tax=Helobdella robusta TaxID=6412 RepID=T1G539_HELRO|nr:hypothetical protein HELRODRAFT_83308 [Helobdella robusta]ESO00236.1 hypothetical protein HELRODRAFT_83308 [Helobdella robusta]